MPDTIPLEINVEWWGRKSIGGAEVGQNTKVSVLQALIFKFMFLNLPHCDGLKMLNTAEPQYNFYIGG